jgi:Rrf2 family protein
MKISSQEEYGLRCLLQLAEADRNGAALTIPEIAAREALSPPYVAKLLAVLRHAGIIDSERGRTGGYHMAKSPAQIRLGTVLMALGEPLFDEAGYCERHKGTESTDGQCVHNGGCNLRALWQTLELWMRQALDQISLQDLLQGQDHLTQLLRQRLAEPMVKPPLAFIPSLSLAKANG